MMARIAPDFRYADYLALTSRMGGDVERMSPRARKIYLQRRLRVVELQIQMLTHRLGLNVEQSGRSWVWSKAPIHDDKWTSLANLDYLMAARDALRRAIDTL